MLFCGEEEKRLKMRVNDSTQQTKRKEEGETHHHHHLREKKCSKRKARTIDNR